MKKTNYLWFFIGISLFCASCCDNRNLDEPTPQPAAGATAANMRIKASYDGQPFILGDSYAYRSGQRILFNRIQFYLTNLKLNDGTKDTKVSDAIYVNLQPSHTAAPTGTGMYMLKLANITAGTYTKMTFGVGVSSDFNNKKPSDFPASSALSNDGEYWTGWSSYIFKKIEGRMDTIGNNARFDLAFAYHTGMNDFYRPVSVVFATPLVVKAGATTDLPVLNIDLKKIFINGSDTIDIKALPTADSPNDHNHYPYLVSVTDNFKKLFQ